MCKGLPSTASSQRCCFVLWGEKCDEAAAALFVTKLRAAGLRVRVVGISGKRIGGAQGLQLVADLALDQALPLVAQAACVIIPCPAVILARFLHDPRLHNFLEIIARREIPLLMAQSESAVHKLDALLELDLSADLITFYPPGEALLPFIRAFAVTVD